MTKNNITRTTFKTFIVVVVLILLMAAAGAGYVWYSGKHPAQTNTKKLSETPMYNDLPKPRPPNPNTPESAAIDALLTPVKAGENTSVTIRTKATSKCTIEVSYNNVKSTDSGLVPKIADDYGNITWSWTVDKSAPAGKWPVKITCQFKDKSAFVEGDLEISK